MFNTKDEPTFFYDAEEVKHIKDEARIQGILYGMLVGIAVIAFFWWLPA